MVSLYNSVKLDMPGKQLFHTLQNVEITNNRFCLAYIHSLIKHGDPIPLCIIKEEKSKRPFYGIKENRIEAAV